MEILIGNQSGAVRHEVLMGRDFLVVPLVLIVPGVLSGSRGSLLYTEEEIEESVECWNGMPMVLNHPVLNGEEVSARKPEILNRYGLGWVFNSASDPRLIAEGWFDIIRTAKIDPRVIKSLNNGDVIELSTGLYTRNEPAEEGATYDGVPYEAVATSYRPDHLAILPDQVGACSLQDGCGVLVNRRTTRNKKSKCLCGNCTLSSKGKRWASSLKGA